MEFNVPVQHKYGYIRDESACEQRTLHIGVRHVTRSSGTRVIYADARAADAGSKRLVNHLPPDIGKLHSLCHTHMLHLFRFRSIFRSSFSFSFSFRFRFIRAPILVRALVVINLLTNTLCTILDQPPSPALRQPSTSVVSNNNNNPQDFAAAAQALDQLDALLAQLADQRGKFIYIC